MLPLVVASRNVGRASSSLAIRHYSRSALVNSEPTLHNATGKWEQLKSKRPFDEDDHHQVFHPPYDNVTTILLVTLVLGGGFGSMAYGVAHQQYKQGYWKK